MPKFIPYDHNQNMMVVINFQDQIQPGTFEYALHYLVEHKLDLSVFYPEYRNEDGGGVCQRRCPVTHAAADS